MTDDLSAGGRSGTQLRCVLDSPAPVALLRLAGVLNLASSVTLRSFLYKALAGQPMGIVVDVSELTVEDDVMLTVFSVFAGTTAQWSGCPVALYAPSASLASALARLAITRTVPVFPTRMQAVAAVEAAPPARRYRKWLPAVPEAAATARRVVVEACHAWRLDAMVDNAEIVVTELVANAVQHAGGDDLHLNVTLGQRFMHIAVRDGSPVAPTRQPPGPDTARRRGLVLIETLCASWGSTPTPDGKVVWVTLWLPR